MKERPIQFNGPMVRALLAAIARQWGPWKAPGSAPLARAIVAANFVEAELRAVA